MSQVYLRNLGAMRIFHTSMHWAAFTPMTHASGVETLAFLTAVAKGCAWSKLAALMATSRWRQGIAVEKLRRLMRPVVLGRAGLGALET